MFLQEILLNLHVLACILKVLSFISKYSIKLNGKISQGKQDK